VTFLGKNGHRNLRLFNPHYHYLFSCLSMYFLRRGCVTGCCRRRGGNRCPPDTRTLQPAARNLKPETRNRLLSEEGRKSVSYLVASMKAGAEEAAFALAAAGRTLPAQVPPDSPSAHILYYIYIYTYIFMYTYM